MVLHKNKILQKQVVVVMASLLMLILGNMISYGAEEAIRAVSVAVTSSVEANAGMGVVAATSSDGRYTVISSGLVNGKENWSAGEVPRVEIELQASSGYFFNTVNSGNITVKGASYVASKRSDNNHSLIITVKLNPVKGVLGKPEEAGWRSSSLGRAKWSQVEYAPAYELKLYCGDRLVHHVEKTTASSHDFFPYMTKKGDYYYQVRAIAKTSSESQYLKAGEWVESEFQEITLKDATAAENLKPGQGQNQKPNQGFREEAPGWVQDQNGWWYRNEDKTYPRNTWQIINGKWYLFDMNGYMMTGWQKWNGRNYYMTSNGDLVTEWLQYDRIWYYIDVNDGTYTDGWLQLGDTWYYLNRDGQMVTGWLKWKEQWYYLDPVSGQMVTNQMVESYYLNNDGVWVP